MTYKLIICSIPIGHSDDITYRVKQCLKNISVIFCEDTRHAKVFLNNQGIWNDQILIRMDQYKEKNSFHVFDSYIQSNDVAYITDAGTPAISDPGALLVNYARTKGVPVSVLGGISSLTTFMMGAGVLTNEFYFGGFFPRKDGDIQEALAFVTSAKTVGIWFESPKRLLKSILVISQMFPNIEVVAAKELSKTYETFIRGQAINVYQELTRIDCRGEWVFLIDARYLSVDHDAYYLKLASDFKSIGLTAKQIKQIAPLFDLNKNDLYDKFQTL